MSLFYLPPKKVFLALTYSHQSRMKSYGHVSLCIFLFAHKLITLCMLAYMPKLSCLCNYVNVYVVCMIIRPFKILKISSFLMWEIKRFCQLRYMCVIHTGILGIHQLRILCAFLLLKALSILLNSILFSEILNCWCSLYVCQTYHCILCCHIASLTCMSYVTNATLKTSIIGSFFQLNADVVLLHSWPCSTT